MIDNTWELWLLLTCLALIAVAALTLARGRSTTNTRDYYRVFMRDQAAKRAWRSLMESDEGRNGRA